MERQLTKLFESALCTLFKENGVDVPEKDLFKPSDIGTTRFADYQYNGVLRLFRVFNALIAKNGGSLITTPQTFSTMLIDHVKLLDTGNIIDKMELSKAFINITINNDSIFRQVMDLGKVLVTSDFTSLNTDNPKKIVVDYSSPNVAKSLHIGHLRSTIIGESITRLLMTAGHDVIGLNHIGDWGTQFGMIIMYLKTIYGNDEEMIMKFVEGADSDHLMKVYRNAKIMFDGKQGIVDMIYHESDGCVTSREVVLGADPTFANGSREQTYKLQQGDEFNTKLWKCICKISSNEYSKIYNMLNIKHLIERGESFYQPIIPDVLDKIEAAGYLRAENGAKIIQLPGWSYPLIVVKSDGGYTYDTTDLAALYHRLCVMDVDEAIYVTDSGQAGHFTMCFEVAEKMGWTASGSKKLRHIGFGLVCGKDGTKLKTRSGETVRMLDVIDEVINLSEKIINERASGKIEGMGMDSVTAYYEGKSADEIKENSRSIGINTLKYFDLSHNFNSNYKYDPDMMFRFTGDTGVYLMYCFARINGIIEKSSMTVDRNDVTTLLSVLNSDTIDQQSIRFDNETRKLLLHINGIFIVLNEALNTVSTTCLTRYLYDLCTLFNSYIAVKDNKIIGSKNEAFGISLCIITSKIIENVFDILTFDKVEHI